MCTGVLRHLVTGLWGVALVGAMGMGCGPGNISGVLRSTKEGDLSNPPAVRIDGLPPVQQACANAAATTAEAPLFLPAFAREPYVQRTTANSARLLWVGAVQPTPSVVVSNTAGDIVGEFPVSPDPGGATSSGRTQWLAAFDNLDPDASYCYQVRVGGAVAPRVGFRTAPAPGTGSAVRFLAFGDSGAGSDQLPLLEQMRTVPFDFIVHTGDIAYDGGTRGAFEANFFRVYADLLKSVPVFPASGNHEYDSQDAAPFREVFDLPLNGGVEGAERWYSFDWGDVHFAILDTERTGPAQAAWLDADLTANRLPWTVVVSHKPPFSSGNHGSDRASRQHFVPIFEKHGVPLVLNGHDHDYERSLPQNGVTYVVTGGGGRGVRSMSSSTFTAFGEAVIHLVAVTVQGNELALHAIDGVGKEFDSLVIRR